MIFQGSITAALFNDFVRFRVLPHCTRFEDGGPRSVIALDNAKIHWNHELVNMLDEAGVELARLPPYSPDLNPIETSFAVLKAYIRKHQDIGAMYAEEGFFHEFLELAIEAQMGQVNSRNLFRKSFISYEG